MADDKLREAQAFFGERAQDYRRSRTHGDPRELARMVAWLAPPPGARALDVATGGGHTALALRDAGCQVVASDATPAMLAQLRGDLPALVAADAQALPFRAGAFDVVASRIAPHHFPDLPAFCREAARALRPGGRLYVFDLTTPEDPEAARAIDRAETLRDPSHVHSWPPSAWRDALARAGLRVERMEETSSTFELEPWVARARMPPERERELRALLAERRGRLGGYGLTEDGRMRVLRVELLAVRP